MAARSFAYVVGDLEGIEGRYGQILREASGPVHAHPEGVSAQVPAAARQLRQNPQVTWPSPDTRSPIFEAADFLADLHDLAHILMPHVHGHGNGLLGPVVPFPDVHVRAADGGLSYLDENIVVPHFGLGGPDELEPGAALGLG